MYQLISATPSPYARKVRIALLEKGFQALVPERLNHAVLYLVTLRDAHFTPQPTTSTGLRPPWPAAHRERQ